MEKEDLFYRIHQQQLEAIPRCLHRALKDKLENLVFDAGDYFHICENIAKQKRWLQTKEGVEIGQHQSIFLIDHAWTFENDGLAIKKTLQENEPLRERIETMFCLRNGVSFDSESLKEKDETDGDGASLAVDESILETLLAAVDYKVTHETARKVLAAHNNELINALSAINMNNKDNEHFKALEQVRGSLDDLKSTMQEQVKPKGNANGDCTKTERVDRIFSAMWRYSSCYSYVSMVDSGNGAVPQQKQVWYVMDEVGSSVQHSSSPNTAIIPFIYSDGKKLQPFSVMWPISVINGGCVIERNFVPAVYQSSLLNSLAYTAALFPSSVKDCALEYEPLLQLYVEQRREPLPIELPNAVSQGSIPSRKLKLYSDMSFVREHFAAEFLTDDISEATVCWLYQDIKLYNRDFTGQLVSQFPHEECLVQKHNLAKLIESRNGATGCKWFPVTYSLEESLSEASGRKKDSISQFMSDHLHEPRYWIVKPANLARGMGIFISGNTARIVKLAQVQPTLVQEYLLEPCLFRKCKFDLRFIVLVTSINPLRLYVYRKFWIRSANIPYNRPSVPETMCCLPDIEAGNEQHFTVMNYKRDATFKQINCDEFIEEFGVDVWPDVESKIYSSFIELFSLSASTPAPTGMATEEGATAFGVYGIDVMLNGKFDPYILEVNFNPDCGRAVENFPQFVSQIMSQVAADNALQFQREKSSGFASLV